MGVVAPRVRSRWDRGGPRQRAWPTTPLEVLDWEPVQAVARAVAAFAALAAAFHVILPKAVPFGTFLYGVVIGCINALIAVGLILIYRSNRIINFAQAEMGVFGGALFEELDRQLHVPWLLAALAGVAAAAGLGAAVEYTLVRRFARSPRLILTVVTIGIAQLVVVATYATTALFPRRGAGGNLTTPLTPIKLTITTVVFRGDHLLLVVLVPVMILGLNAYLRRTDFGVAVRAAAESGERAALLGVPVKRVSTVMWTVAAGFTGLATVLRAPVIGLVAGSSIQGPGILLRALTAAVIARMEDIRVAVVAAIAVGVIEQALYYNYGGNPITDLVLAGLIVGSLLLQRSRGGRAEDADRASSVGAEEVKAVPRQLRHLPEVRWGKVAVASLLAAVLLAFPFVASVGDQVRAGTVVIYALVAVSLVVLSGWAGQISLGQFGLVGLGAGVGARLLADAHVDLFLAIAGAALAGAAAALVLGLAALRVRGFFFAVTSLGFAVAVNSYVLNPQYFGRLTPHERPERPFLFGRYDLGSERTYYYFLLAALVLVVLMVSLLRRSRPGRAIVAVRDNEKAAQAYGLDQVRVKLMAFGLSGGIAGMAGALFAFQQHAVDASAFSPAQSLSVFSMAVIGGLGSLPGAILGALFVRGNVILLPPQLAVLATGVGLLVVLLVFPGGLGRLLFSGRDAVLRRIAARRGLVVPSLLADQREVEPDPPSLDPAAGDLLLVEVAP